MILQYFKKKENEYKKIADKIYTSVLRDSKNLIKDEYFLKVDFDSSFELISIILVFYLKTFKDLKLDKYKLINDELIKNLINDLDISIREVGIGDMNIGKYVKKYVKKFYFRVKIIDAIFDKYNQSYFIDYLISIKNINKENTNELALQLVNIYENIKNNSEYS
jgi:hypothetical protein